MARQLKNRVCVNDTWYEAGTTPPAAVAAKITNPAAWGEEAEAPIVAPGGDLPPANAKLAELQAFAEANSIDLDGATKKDDIRTAIDAWAAGDEIEIPGPEATIDELRAFAETHDIDLGDADDQLAILSIIDEWADDNLAPED
ncbi:MAG: hypothetical protein AAF567_24475 [Actinomycetota bacterium]